MAPLNMHDRGVITLATGKPYYLGLAVNLARSFRQWHPGAEIGFTLVTDIAAPLPADLGWVDLVRLSAGELPAGFGGKLHLGDVAQARANLFIDADCLVFGRLSGIFDRWAGRPFVVIGELVSEGEFFGDVPSRCRQFGVAAVPRLVGSVYYWEQGEESARIFATARSFARDYDELGFVRLRNGPNEEPLLSVALAQEGLSPEADDGTIKADAMSFRVLERCDTSAGRPRLANPGAGPATFPTWLRLAHAEPLILHFNDGFAEGPAYLREQARLRLRLHLAPASAAFLSGLAVFPRATLLKAKDFLRPAFARIFGTRPVRAGSPRT